MQGDATGGWVVKRLPPPPGGLTRFSVYLRDRDDLPEQPPIPDGPPYSDAVRISSRDDKQQQPDETGKQPSQGGEGTVSQPASQPGPLKGGAAGWEREGQIRRREG